MAMEPVHLQEPQHSQALGYALQSPQYEDTQCRQIITYISGTYAQDA